MTVSDFQRGGGKTPPPGSQRVKSKTTASTSFEHCFEHLDKDQNFPKM